MSSPLYQSWLRTQGLPEEAVSRILERALRAQDADLLLELANQELTDTQRLQLLRSGHGLAVRALIAHAPEGDELICSFIAESEPSELVALGLQHISVHGSTHRSALWATGNETLRLGVLRSLRSPAQSEPGWDAWLAKKLAGSSARGHETLVSVAANSTSYAWSQIGAWSNPRWIAELYSMSERSFAGHSSEVREWIVSHEEQISDAQLIWLNRVCSALLVHEEQLSYLHRMPAYDAFLAVCERSAARGGTCEVAGRLAEQVRVIRGAQQMRLRQQASFEHGEILPEHVEAVVAGIGAIGWYELAAHAKLHPAQGVRILATRNYQEIVEGLPIIMADRSDAWLRSFARHALASAHLFRHVMRALPETERLRVIEELVVEDEANIATIHECEWASGVTVSKLRISELLAASESARRVPGRDAITRASAAYVAAALGTNASMWESFERLSQELELTLGELVELARSLNVLVED